MKRILSALFIAGLLGTSCIAKITEEPKRAVKSEQTAAKKDIATQDTEYICSIGLEGEGAFIETYDTKAECKKFCKGGATICQKTAKSNPIDTEDVD